MVIVATYGPITWPVLPRLDLLATWSGETMEFAVYGGLGAIPALLAALAGRRLELYPVPARAAPGFFAGGYAHRQDLQGQDPAKYKDAVRLAAVHGLLGKRVLEVACGAGHMLAELVVRPEVIDVVGVELAPIGLVDGAKGCTVVRASVLDLPFPDDCFDTVISLDLWQYLDSKDLDDAWCEQLRVARTVIASFPVLPFGPRMTADLLAFVQADPDQRTFWTELEWVEAARSRGLDAWTIDTRVPDVCTMVLRR